jgi:membrane protein DedA with SNARE-associated domain
VATKVGCKSKLDAQRAPKHPSRQQAAGLVRFSVASPQHHRKTPPLAANFLFFASKPAQISRLGDRMAEFIATYGIWVVAAFIALESVGIPVPAEAALIGAAVFCARTHHLDICSLIAAGIFSAIVGEVVGFWLGRTFGYKLLTKYGGHLGLNEGKIRIGQSLFARHGSMFVFTARFLPFFRNVAAVLAGTNCMAQSSFYIASATAAVFWVIGYGLAGYFLGDAMMNSSLPVTVSIGLAALIITSGLPTLVARYEKRVRVKSVQTIHPECQ